MFVALPGLHLRRDGHLTRPSGLLRVGVLRDRRECGG